MKPTSDKLLFFSITGFAFFIPLSKFAVSLFFVLTILFFFVNGEKLRSFKKIFASRYILAVTIYLFIHLVGLLWSDSFSQGLSYIQKMLFLLLVPIIAISLKCREREFVLYSFISGVLVSLFISYMILLFDLQFLKHPSAFGPVPFIDHRHYSVLLAIVTAVLLIFFLEREMSLKHKIILISAMVLLVINLLLSGGRIGVVVLFFLSIYVATVYWKRLKWIAFVFPLILITLVFVFYLYAGGFNYRAYLAYRGLEKVMVENDYNSSWGGRLALDAVGYELIKDNLLIGCGTGDVENEMKKKIEEEFPEFITTGKLYVASDFHNQFVQDFVMLGLPGVFSLLFVIYSLYSMKIKNVVFGRIKTILLITFILFGFTEIVLHSMVPLVTFLLLSSLLQSEEIEN